MKIIAGMLIICGSVAAVSIELIRAGHWMAATILFIFTLGGIKVKGL